MTIEIKGRDLVTGIPKTMIITDEEVRDAIWEPISTIVETVKIALERTPPSWPPTSSIGDRTGRRWGALARSGHIAA